MFSRSLSKEFLIKSITRSLIIFKKLRKMTNDFFNHYIFIYMRDSRRVTRNVIRAGKFSRNQGTSINMSSRTHERKAGQGKNTGIFLLETLKTTFKMRNLTRDGHSLGIFFAKIEALFSIFEKGQGRPPPRSPFQLRAWAGRRFSERIIDHSCRDNKSHLFEHAEKTGHGNVNIDHFEILSNSYRNNKFKRKLAESLHIKHERPGLSIQEQSVPLRCSTDEVKSRSWNRQISEMDFFCEIS